MNYADKSNVYINKLIEITNEPNSYTKELQEAWIAYIFGILNGLAYAMDEEPVRVQTVMLATLMRTFDMSIGEANAFVQFLIEATDEDFHPTYNAIIHNGIDAYEYLVQEDNQQVESDWNEICNTIKSSL